MSRSISRICAAAFSPPIAWKCWMSSVPCAGENLTGVASAGPIAIRARCRLSAKNERARSIGRKCPHSFLARDLGEIAQTGKERAPRCIAQLRIESSELDPIDITIPHAPLFQQIGGAGDQSDAGASSLFGWGNADRAHCPCVIAQQDAPDHISSRLMR